MAKLINGNGNRAIYAAQDADLIASLAGNVTCIANVGNKYAATIEDANTIGLADGVIITKEGRRIQLDAGDVDLFAIPTGSSGVTNYYIIGYKLVQQADSSQVAETFVQKMDSSSATIAEGTLRGGDNEVYVSVYRVTQVGFTIDSVDGLLPELTNISKLNSDLSNKVGKAWVHNAEVNVLSYALDGTPKLLLCSILYDISNIRHTTPITIAVRGNETGYNRFVAGGGDVYVQIDVNWDNKIYNVIILYQGTQITPVAVIWDWR